MKGTFSPVPVHNRTAAHTPDTSDRKSWVPPHSAVPSASSPKASHQTVCLPCPATSDAEAAPWGAQQGLGRSLPQPSSRQPSAPSSPAWQWCCLFWTAHGASAAMLGSSQLLVCVPRLSALPHQRDTIKQPHILPLSHV